MPQLILLLICCLPRHEYKFSVMLLFCGHVEEQRRNFDLKNIEEFFLFLKFPQKKFQKGRTSSRRTCNTFRIETDQFFEHKGQSSGKEYYP